MIEKLEISGVHTKLDKKAEDYAQRKIGNLDKFVARRHRPGLHAEIKLIGGKIKARQTYTCEVVLYLPHQELVVKEPGENFLAAIDLAEAKLKLQLKKYKDKHSNPKFYRRLSARLGRKT